MAGPTERTDETALWRRWRAAARREAAPAAEIDPLLLAAYAEGRLAPAEAETVEDWLAAHPEAVADILAARGIVEAALPIASETALDRAAVLVSAGDAQILAFRPSPIRSWRAVASWGALAASILVTSLVGFTLGNDTYANLTATTTTTATALGQDLLDPPTGLFYSFDEDSNT